MNRLASILAVALLASACASRGPLGRQECGNPDAELARLLKPYEALRAKGCTAECDQLRREIERLAMVCPGHTPTLMANAVFAYDDRRLATAQQLLDLILAQQGSHPETTVLRARIAIEEGNLPFARRLLEQQIRLAPDHAGLHETLGAALYLARELAEAEPHLIAASKLGAPAWRIAYHLGLIREAQGRFDDALKLYTEALAANPAWAPAQSRVNAIRAMSRPSR